MYSEFGVRLKKCAVNEALRGKMNHSIIVGAEELSASGIPSEIGELGEIFEQLNLAYVPSFYFDSRSDYHHVEKMHRHLKVHPEMEWLGHFYREQILNGETAAVKVKWVDDAVGFGLFAGESLNPGEFLGIYAGHVSWKGFLDFRVRDYAFRHPTYHWWRGRFVIDAEKVGNALRFMNHSYCPNVECVSAYCESFAYIIARTISAVDVGEQLAFDYGPDYWNRREPPVDLHYQQL